ncbi:antibiotic biosynthesis monooxygenase [bacterium]|nr:antibiotic biosynthesis monooxygenase [candidate division CSSED10-310 bacterium]
MILVKITMEAFPEKQEEIMQTLLAMIETMRQVKGCRSYQVFRNIKNENSFSSLNEWATRSDLDEYLGSDKFGVLLGMKSLLSSSLQIKILTVSHTEGNDFIKTLRIMNNPQASPMVQKGAIKKT